MNVLHDLRPGNTPDEINVLIEIPKGSANKYEIDKESGLIFHDRVFYGSHVYPTDYGFMPQTHWHDGDPLDVMVMSTHPFVPGVFVPARPIGVIRMIDNGEKDEKLISVPVNDPRFDNYQDIGDVAPHLLKEWQNFFETYKILENKKVEIKKIEGAEAARAVVEEGLALYKEKYGKKSMKLPREFYAADTLTVARNLLGKVLVRKYRGQRLSGRIVEVEAYLGPGDAASHARHGPESRAKPMFGEPGHAYIYFTYGMYYCMNCVTEAAGSGTGILIRALEPVEGKEEMRKLRQKRNPGKQLPERQLTNGPGKLAQALQLDKRLNGTDLLGDVLWLEDAPAVLDTNVGRSARVGISDAREFPWRFYVKDSPFVSAHPKY